LNNIMLSCPNLLSSLLFVPNSILATFWLLISVCLDLLLLFLEEICKCFFSCLDNSHHVEQFGMAFCIHLLWIGLVSPLIVAFLLPWFTSNQNHHPARLLHNTIIRNCYSKNWRPVQCLW
jgi:hypothetical protein